MSTTATATKKVPSEITSPVIYKVTSKANPHDICFLVKSDHQENVYYKVCWKKDAMRWECSCPATRSCKHSRAVRETLLAKRHLHDAERSRYNYYEMAIGA